MIRKNNQDFTSRLFLHEKADLEKISFLTEALNSYQILFDLIFEKLARGIYRELNDLERKILESALYLKKNSKD
jgi:tRNA U34 5-carboxymethylaminomethyl modifying GTPase MnmE/TrmE